MRTTIGILLDHKVLRNIPARKTGHERIGLYQKAARKLGASVVFFSLKTIQFSKKKIVGYVPASKRTNILIRPIPRIVHNRSMSTKIRKRQQLKRLSSLSYVFNAKNRYSKLRIHRLLNQSSVLQSHLPDTVRYGKKALSAMMLRHDSLFIKPLSSSVGKGIIRIKKLPSGKWSLRKGRKSYELRAKQVFPFLSRMTRGQSYLIQQGIDLARYRNRPYDIRVTVQRGGTGSWQVTGMVGKVAGRGKYLTNVARGGTAVHCEKLFSASGFPVSYTKQRVRSLSLSVAEHLSAKLPRLADLGLDIGVDRTGHPYFIEMNGRDQRYAFAKAGMKHVFRRTYENPIHYALYVANR